MSPDLAAGAPPKARRRPCLDRGLPFLEWSPADKRAWLRAFPEDAWKRALAAKNPKVKQQSQSSLDNQRQAVEFFFGMLGRDAPEVMSLPIPQRFCPDTLELWIDDLADGNAPRSVHDFLSRARHALATLAPGPRYAWMATRANMIPGRSRASQRPRPNATREELLDAACAVMDRLKPALKAPRPNLLSDPIAEEYRNALMIAVLAAKPSRLSNFIAHEIGRSIKSIAGRYNIYVAKADEKTGAADTGVLPPRLTPYVDFYIAVVRPRLAAVMPGDALWVSQNGLRMPAASAHAIITTTTLALVGERLTCHDFRYCYADTLVREDRSLDDIQFGLNHRPGSPVTDHKYIRAKRTDGRVLAAAHMRKVRVKVRARMSSATPPNAACERRQTAQVIPSRVDRPRPPAHGGRVAQPSLEAPRAPSRRITHVGQTRPRS
jgi:hypothetical protein